MSYHIFVEPFTWILLRHYRECLHSLSLFSLLTHALTCLRSGQALQESAPPKKIRMLATYM